MQSGGRKLVRKVTLEKKRKYSKPKQPLGLTRYLNTRGTPQGVHEFKKTAWAEFNVTTAGIQVPGGGVYQPDFVIRFDLNNVVVIGAGSTTIPVPGITELAALFDQIKLDKVVVRFRSRNDSAPGAGGANAATFIGTCFDFNDDDVATSSTIREYSNFKDDCIEPGGREHIRTLKPCYLMRITDDDGIGVASQTKRGYVNSGSSCRHYGLKGNITGPTGGNVLQLSVEYVYKCKLSR